MNSRIIKLLFLVFTCFVFFLTTNTNAFASDYKYKVLDPKYNPQAQELIDGKYDNYENYNTSVGQQGFDFGVFFALFALILFPTIVLHTALKTFKKVSCNLKSNNINPIIGNIKIDTVTNIKNDNTTTVDTKTASVPNEKTETVTEILTQNTDNTDKIKKVNNPIQNTPKQACTEPKIPNISINNYFSSPIEKIPNPMLLNTSPLTSNKGLCVVEYNKKYSLIGYINEEVFLLNQFDFLKNTEIRSRLTETNKNSDRYIVKLGDYQAVVEVKDKEMKLLLEL